MTVRRGDISEWALWGKAVKAHTPVMFDAELTARCNNDCTHCYINLPAGDREVRAAELSTAEWLELGAQAADLGALSCLLTGGEPLLRDDFADIYLGFRRLGLLVSVFTNACLVDDDVVELFRRYPPRDIEVSVYGATRETYERVSRRRGSYDAFVRGLDMLLEGGVPVRLKAMAIRSTRDELDEIGAFCRARTSDYYRFDPLLHLRLDGDARRNEEIRAERLPAAEIVAIERADAERKGALQNGCAEDGDLVSTDFEHWGCDHLFHCGAGILSFTVGYEGTFRVCTAMCHPDTVVSVRAGAPGAVTLREAWQDWIPHVRDLRGSDPDFLERCRKCDVINLCMYCPAHAFLETGRMDAWVGYFCEVAHARAAVGLGTAGC